MSSTTQTLSGLVTSGAAVTHIAFEKSVISVVVTDEHGSQTQAGTYRVEGASAQMLGVMHALRIGSFEREPGQLNVLAPANITETINTFRKNGTITLPETVHPLGAVIRIHDKLISQGWKITFTPGAVSVPDADAAKVAFRVEQEKALVAKKAATPWELPAQDKAWVEANNATVVYTDGSHMARTGFGAWAWWVDETHNACGTLAATTTTHVERLAILRALRAIPGPVLVVTDCSHAVLPEGKRGRTTSGGHARVARALRRLAGNDRVRILQVLGHDTCPGNLAVDRLAGSTLATTWAQVCRTPVLRDRLLDLAQTQEVKVREARKLAAARSERQHQQWQAHREKKQAQRAAALASTDLALVAS